MTDSSQVNILCYLLNLSSYLFILLTRSTSCDTHTFCIKNALFLYLSYNINTLNFGCHSQTLMALY